MGEIKQSIQSGGLQKERVPLVDKISNRIRAMSDDIRKAICLWLFIQYLDHTIEDIKDSFKIEESPHDYEPLLDKVMDGYNRICK